MQSTKFRVGDTVKYSGYALQGSRDYWQRCGREPQKSNAKRAYEEKAAYRGTVISVEERGIHVQAGDSIHNSLKCMWDIVE